MTPERWQKIEQLYHATLEREESQRTAYLHEVCTGDDALRREVESLLGQEKRGDGFLESPAIEVAARAMAKDSRQSLNGQQLGSYKILSLLGAGGMGEVYQARDTKLGRDVAIKVLPSAFVHDPDRLSRFQREARMLAALYHPNIATIYGLEQSEGAHYLVMELVPGHTLAERVSSGVLKIEEALKVAAQIAEALEAAHEKGVRSIPSGSRPRARRSPLWRASCNLQSMETPSTAFRQRDRWSMFRAFSPPHSGLYGSIATGQSSPWPLRRAPTGSRGFLPTADG
jgi:hypothetical protein